LTLEEVRVKSGERERGVWLAYSKKKKGQDDAVSVMMMILLFNNNKTRTAKGNRMGERC